MRTQTTQKRVQFARALRRDILRVFAVIVFVFVLLLTGHTPATSAATPTLNFQARLENGGGAIAADGNYNIEFKLYQGGTSTGGGTLKWTEDWLNSASNGVHVANGYLTVNLGSITSFPGTINWDDDLFLSMNVGNTNTSCTPFSSCVPDGEMTPYLKLTSVPYAFQAQSASQLQVIQGGYTGTLAFDTLSGNQSILLPNASGTVCLDDSVNNCGYLTSGTAGGSFVQLQGTTPGTAQTGNFNISGAGIAGSFLAQETATPTVVQFATKLNGVSYATILSNGVASFNTVTANTLYGNSATPTQQVVQAQLNGSTLAYIQSNGDASVQNLTVGASKTITLTGGATGTRPASPTEGMLYYDTTTKQLLVYANGKWQADRSTATKIVAASNSSQAIKDSADYVATGTGDQATINSALTAAAGGKVYLAEGTYTVNASISIPNNTTLTGAGNGTMITIPNSFNAAIKLITNTDTATGTGITVSNLKLDGNKANQTSGLQDGINFSHVGNVAASRQGAIVQNIWASNFRNVGIGLTYSDNSIASSNISNNNYYGIDVENLYNSSLTANTMNQNTLGVYTYGVGQVTVSGNNVSNGSNDGYHIDSSTAVAVAGNTSNANAGNGFQIYNSSNVTVTGNTASGNTLSGVDLIWTNKSIVSSNTLSDNSGATKTDSVYISASNSNTIIGNSSTDTSCTTSCYAINIDDSSSSANYLANNNLGGGSINDAGTGTIYGGQLNASSAYVLQASGGLNLNSATTVSANLTVTNAGNVAFQKGSDYSTTGTTNNVNFGTGALFRLTGASAQTITGIAGGTDGRILTLINAGSTDATLKNNDTVDSSAGNLIITGTGSDYTIAAGSSVSLVYDNGASVWRLVGAVAGGLGGGSYVSLQAGSPGTTDVGNFNINGTGIAAILQGSTSVLTPLLDTATAATLNIGTTNATQINLNQNVVVASSKTFTVSGGATSLTGATTGDAVTISNSTSTGNIAVFKDNATAVATIADGGAVRLQNSSNSTSGFSVQDSAGNYVLQLDTTSGYLGINQPSPQAPLDVGIGKAGTFTDGFESGLLTPMVSTSPSPWTVNNVTANSGTYSARSGAIGNSSSTTMSITKTLSTGGTVSFYRWTSSESCCDALHFYIDGVQQGQWSGATAWGLASYAATAGTHTFSWTYSKDSNTSGGSDTVRVDDIQITNVAAGTVSATFAGSVGIGTASPGYALDIQGGSINTAQGLYVAGTQLVTSGLAVQNATGVSTTGNLVVATTTATQDRILVTAASIASTARFDGTVTNADLTAARTWTLPNESGTFCMQGSTNCGFATSTGSGNYIQNQNAAQQTSANFWISGTGRADTGLTTPLIDTASATILNLGTTNATQINLNKNVVVAASQSLTITGGATGTRPASPTEGMLYYDTTTKQLLTYANGKWQADRESNTKIIAPSNASQAVKDSADYVATGTNDATTINTAISTLPAGGGTVYLLPGTFTLGATSISLPNNTTLAGAGAATVLTYPNSMPNATYRAIINSDTSTGTRVTVRDLRIDGNSAGQTTGFFTGVYFSGMGAGSGSSAREGSRLSNLTVTNLNGDGISLSSSSNNMITGNTALTNGNSGIVIANTSTNNTIANNKVQGNANQGIYLDTSCDNNTISGNTVQQSSGSGITLGGSSYNTITGNFSQDNGGSGIEIDTSSNTVTGNTSQGNSVNGITVFGTAHTISGNTVEGNGNAGIFIGSSSSYINVTGNSVTSNTTYGIYLSFATNNTINANKLHDNGDTTTNNAIYLTGADSNTLTSNGTTDTSATTTNYAINISDSTSDNNYLADNTLGGGSINDAGTGTIYGGQLNSSGAYVLQAAGGVAINSTTTISANLTVTNAGNVAFQKGTDYSTTGTSNNVNFGTGVLFRLTGASAQTITGIAGGTDGRILTLVNAAGQAAILKNNDITDSSAANVIITGTGADLSIAAGASVSLVYDSGSSVWRVVGTISGTTSGSSYVTLQGTTPGTADTGNFNISGTGIANVIQVSAGTGQLDTATSGILHVGTTNATQINLDQNVVVANGKTLSVGVNSTTIFQDGFESDDSRAPFTPDQTPSESWTVVTTGAYAGTRALKAASIANNTSSTTTLQKTLTQAGTISFARKVSSEQDYDFLRFYIDDVQQAQWSGEVAWGTVSYAVTSGFHTFKWEYAKDSGTAAGSDAAWIDEVQITGTYLPSASFQGDLVLSSNSSTSPISPLLPESAFSQAARYSAGDNRSIVSADFNGDGKMDIAAADSYGAKMQVLMNKGDGTLLPKVEYTIASGQSYIATGDFNADGKPDLAVTVMQAKTVSVFINNGNGTFAAKVDYTTGTSSPYAVATGDFNADGKPDLAVVGTGVSVFMNTGTGTFAAKVDYETGSSFTYVTSADFSGDGKPDLAVGNSSSYGVWILTNTGTGSFGAMVGYSTVGRPAQVVAADFNADGKIDIASANKNDSDASVLLNSGTGTFPTSQTYETGKTPYAITSADYNGDGAKDIAVVNDYDNTVSVLLGSSTGTFSSKIDFATGNSPLGLASTDLNGDGRQDIIVGSNSERVLLVHMNLYYRDMQLTSSGTTAKLQVTSDASQGGIYVQGAANQSANLLQVQDSTGKMLTSLSSTGQLSVGGAPVTHLWSATEGTLYFAPVANIQTESYPYGVTTADFNGDGWKDIAADNGDNDVVSVLISNGDGTYQPKVEYPTANLPQAVDSADFNGDGKPDLVTANSSGATDTISVLMNNGDGTFATKVDYTAANEPVHVRAIDLNGDGKADIVTSNYSGSGDSISVYLNNGDGTFAAKVDYPVAGQANNLTVGDFNGDGKNDVAVVDQYSDLVSVFMNNGDGTFAAHVDYATNTYPWAITNADINGDGKLDLIVSNVTPVSVSVYLNNGDGTFATKVDYSTTGKTPYAITSGDFNGDGKPDVAYAESDNGSIGIMLNNGDGTLSSEITYIAADDPQQIITSDLNNDGKTDLLTANYNGGFGVSAFINKSADVSKGTISVTTTSARDGGIYIMGSADQVAPLFLIQSAQGLELMKVTGQKIDLAEDTTITGSLTVKTSTATNDSLALSVTAGGTGAFTGTVTNADLTAARTWTLPDESGTICVIGSTSCKSSGGFVQFAAGIVQSDSSTNASISINKTGASGNIVQLQSGGTSIFTIGNTGDLVIGTVTNNVTFASGSSFEPILNGSARHSKTIKLNAEYVGATLDTAADPSCSSANSGTMISGYTTAGVGGLPENYYDWTSTAGTAQCYDVVVQIALPSDFDGWTGTQSVDVYSTNTTNGTLALDIRDVTGALDGTAFGSSLTPASASTWTNKTFSFANTYTYSASAGKTITLRIRMSALSSAHVRIGAITLNYKSHY